MSMTVITLSVGQTPAGATAHLYGHYSCLVKWGVHSVQSAGCLILTYPEPELEITQLYWRLTTIDSIPYNHLGEVWGGDREVEGAGGLGSPC